MEIDLDRTRICKQLIAEDLKDKTEAERLDQIRYLAVSLACPIIAVGCYVAELYGMTEDLEMMIRFWMKWYDVDKVFGYQGEHNAHDNTRDSSRLSRPERPQHDQQERIGQDLTPQHPSLPENLAEAVRAPEDL